MTLLIRSQTSIIVLLRFGTGCMIPSPILLVMWLFISPGIKVIQCYEKGPMPKWGLPRSTKSKSCPGPRFNLNMTSYQYRKVHCGDKANLWSSHLHTGIPYTGMMTSLYWIWAMAPEFSHDFLTIPDILIFDDVMLNYTFGMGFFRPNKRIALFTEFLLVPGISWGMVFPYISEQTNHRVDSKHGRWVRYGKLQA